MGKKIISFSLWGTDEKYWKGAEENLKLVPIIYPGWIARFYISNTVPQNTVDFLQNNGAEIIIKDKSVGYRGLMWRFETMFDKTVDYFLIRDTDSRLNAREADAVNEWIASGKSFHIMRDHKGHDVHILGAMWGAKTFFLHDIEKLYYWFLKETLNVPTIKRAPFFYYDQIFLNRMIWPRVQKDAMVHDDMKRFTGDEKPFKVKLPFGRFIGQQYGADNNPLETPV